MLLKDLLKEAGMTLPINLLYLQNALVGKVVCRADQVTIGDIYVAIRGFHVNGEDYASVAVARGACLVVAETSCGDFPTLITDSARRALAYLCDAYYGHPAKEMCLIGITGTNGKTSTATMLYEILSRAGHSVGLIGTVECLLNREKILLPNADPLANMTTPDPSELYAMLDIMRRGGAAYVIMEVTSHALALQKVAPLQFQRALFTNLTSDHLDLHGTMEQYFASKKSLFDRTDVAVINALSTWGRRLADDIDRPVIIIDSENVVDVVSRCVSGSTFTLKVHQGDLPVKISIPGRFFVENAALAARTALSLGVSPATIIGTLSAFSGVKGRMERVSGEEDDISVFLDYAHTPDALEKLLFTVRSFRTGESKIILLFGCGGDRDRTKRPLMGQVAAKLADFVILTSDNCRSEDPLDIIDDILEGFDKNTPYTVIPDRASAIAYMVAAASPGDLLLLAGKGHEEYEINGKERRMFSERELVRAALTIRTHASEGKHEN